MILVGECATRYGSDQWNTDAYTNYRAAYRVNKTVKTDHSVCSTHTVLYCMQSISSA